MRRDGMDEWLIIVKPDDGQRTDSRFVFTANRGFPLPHGTNNLGSVNKRSFSSPPIRFLILNPVRSFPMSVNRVRLRHDSATPINVPYNAQRRRFLGSLWLSAGGLLAWSLAGCGPSEGEATLAPDATEERKANLLQNTKPVKPAAGKGGKP